MSTVARIAWEVLSGARKWVRCVDGISGEYMVR